MVEKNTKYDLTNISDAYKEYKESIKTPVAEIEILLKTLSDLYPDKIIIGLNEENHTLYEKILSIAKSENLKMQTFLNKHGFSYGSDKTREVLLKSLTEAYPDKNISGLQKENHKLYTKTRRVAKSENLTLKAFLKKYGFSYGSDKTKKALLKSLTEAYPDKNIRCLSKENPDLYSTVLSIAKREELTVEAFLHKHGFNYIIRTSISEKTESLIKLLTQACPDKNIRGLQKENRKLYAKALLIAKSEEMTVKEFFDKHGFYTIRAPKPDKTEALLELLNEAYPDKNIVGLQKENHKLYTKVQGIAKTKGLTIKEFLNKNGFNYNPKSSTVMRVSKTDKRESLLLEFLNEAYPNKNISGLHEENLKLYNKIRYIAKSHNLTVEAFLHKHGFNYGSKSAAGMRASTETLLEALIELYPDKNISGLQKENRKLYTKARRIAKSEELTVKEFFDKHGFNYVSKNLSARGESLLESLMEAYPDKNIRCFQSKNRNLYERIRNKALAENLTVQEFLNKHGFNYKLNEARVTSILATRKGIIIKRLSEMFPNKVIYIIDKNDLAYIYVSKKAELEGKTVVGYFEELGFMYMDYPKSVADYLQNPSYDKAVECSKYLKFELDKLFPEGIIECFKKQSVPLFMLTARISIDLRTTFELQLQSLGFSYVFSKSDAEIRGLYEGLLLAQSKQKLKDRLMYLFPGKSVTKLSGADIDVYNLAMEIGKASNQSLKPLLKELGFEYR